LDNVKDIAGNANAFASTFLFFATQNATSVKIKKSLQAIEQDSKQCDFETRRFLTDRKAADNN